MITQSDIDRARPQFPPGATDETIRRRLERDRAFEQKQRRCAQEQLEYMERLRNWIE